MGLAGFKPGSLLIYAAVLALTVFILSGSIYVIVEEPPPFLTYRDQSGNVRAAIVNPTIRDQAGSEALVTSALYILGFLGILALSMSYKYSYDPRMSNLLLAIGLILLVVSSIVLWIMVDAKIWHKPL